MRLIQGIGKRAWKMDCCIWQKTRGLYFPWPRRRASSSDDGPANEPSAEILGCRGGARSQEVRKRIFTTDEGSPDLEWHRRYRGSPGALGPHEDRVNGEISTHRQKVRPDRNFSSLRYLTPLADIAFLVGTTSVSGLSGGVVSSLPRHHAGIGTEAHRPAGRHPGR